MLRSRRFVPEWRGVWQRVAWWVSRRLALLGNAMFLLGSLFFLRDALELVGVWFFVIGSAALLLDGMRGGERG